MVRRVSYDKAEVYGTSQRQASPHHRHKTLLRACYLPLPDSTKHKSCVTTEIKSLMKDRDKACTLSRRSIKSKLKHKLKQLRVLPYQKNSTQRKIGTSLDYFPLAIPPFTRNLEGTTFLSPLSL